MSCPAISAVSCAGLILLATPVHAVQGDPLPGIDVSMEQNPGGIIIAQTTTNGTGEFTSAPLKPGTYRTVIKLVGPFDSGQAKTADIALIIKASGRPDNVTRVSAAWKSDTTVGIDVNTTAPSTVSLRIVEGRPQPAAPTSATAGLCTWGSAAYSQGAVFCMGPETAVECLRPPEWAAKKLAACDKAAPVVPR